MDRKNKTICITGASAGIGEACAELFAENGYDLVLVARRKERLDKLKSKLESTHGTNIHVVELDVRDQKEVHQKLTNLPDGFSKVDILINNAGLAAGRNSIQEGSIDDWDRMIDTNVKGLLYVSRAIIPDMVSRNDGHIINIGSIAGKETYLNGNVYCASKHAVDSLTKAMREDLLPHNIKVTGICPGLAETEFSMVRYEGDAEKAKAVYDNMVPLLGKDIAEIILFAVGRPAHVCLNDVVVTPTCQANSFYVHREE